MSFHKIDDKIYLGSVIALRADRSLGEEAGVTHVLSLHVPEPVDLRTKPLLGIVKNHMHVPVEDMESVNLLEWFERTNAFIEDGVRNGSVLVHCLAGVSRSVTCVAAYLMQRNKWSDTKAIEYIQSKRAIADPNDGFRKQLKVYYKCNYSIKNDPKPYREWLLTERATLASENTSAAAVEAVYTPIEAPPPQIVWAHTVTPLLQRTTSTFETNKIDNVTVDGHIYGIMEPVSNSNLDNVQELFLGDIPIKPEVLREVLDAIVTRKTTYRCKGCASVLASSASLISHIPGERGSCQHYFFEPIEWMRPEIEKGELEGRLSCPKCGNKVGGYSWVGTPCTCASWVTPSFKLAAAKVDRMTARL